MCAHTSPTILADLEAEKLFGDSDGEGGNERPSLVFEGELDSEVTSAGSEAEDDVADGPPQRLSACVEDALKGNTVPAVLKSRGAPALDSPASSSHVQATPALSPHPSPPPESVWSLPGSPSKAVRQCPVVAASRASFLFFFWTRGDFAADATGWCLARPSVESIRDLGATQRWGTPLSHGSLRPRSPLSHAHRAPFGRKRSDQSDR